MPCRHGKGAVGILYKKADRGYKKIDKNPSALLTFLPECTIIMVLETVWILLKDESHHQNPFHVNGVKKSTAIIIFKEEKQ